MSPVRGFDGERARAHGRIGFHPQDLALAVEIGIFDIVGNVLQAVGRGRVIGPAHQRQDGGIFRPQPPQRIAGRAIGIGGMDLVEGGDAVQEPDLVLVPSSSS